MKAVNLGKFNFKKVFIVYIIAALIAGVASAVTLGIVFREKISLMIEYRKISEACEENFTATEQKGKLTRFANSSPDVIDILILDKENRIIYTAKNAGFVENETLALEPWTAANSKWNARHESELDFLTDPAKPDVYYRILGSGFPRSLKTLIPGWSARGDFEEKYFYESGAKTVYSLRFIADAKTGEKIYLIFDIKPVPNSGYYIKGVGALAMLFFMLYWILTASAVYANAEKSKLRGAAWGLLTLFTNLAGVLIYLIYKQVNQTCYQCKAVQSRDHLYCTSCGAKLAKACPNCKGNIEKSDSHCAHCGEKLSTK